MLLAALCGAAPIFVILSILSPNHAMCLAWMSSPAVTHSLCLILGVALVFFTRYAAKSISRNGDTDELDGTDSAIYGLDHGRLNMALPPPTMWMNMGYWEVCPPEPFD